MSNKEEIETYFLLTCIEEGNSFHVVLCEPFPFHNEHISEYQWGGRKHCVVLGFPFGTEIPFKGDPGVHDNTWHLDLIAAPWIYWVSFMVSKGSSWIHCSHDFIHAVFPGFDWLWEQRNIVLQMLCLVLSASRSRRTCPSACLSTQVSAYCFQKGNWRKEYCGLRCQLQLWLARQALFIWLFDFSKVKKTGWITFKWTEASGFLLFTGQYVPQPSPSA